MLQTKRITLIFGKICSGKSTFADALCYVTKARRITVSDVVKKLTGLHSRSELQNTKSLDEQIAEQLIEQIQGSDRYVIDGIRQLSIVKALQQHLQFDLDMIWLEVPDITRKHRFEDRVLSKDDISFELADKQDEQLGLAVLQKCLQSEYIVINN